jgi:Rrf2 family protein
MQSKRTYSKINEVEEIKVKLSSKGRYGMKAIIDLADYGETQPVSISDIAVRQNVSAAYLEQLLPKLRRAGLIKSERGVQGGYQLAKPADQISVGDILIALDENLSLVECLDEDEETEALSKNNNINAGDTSSHETSSEKGASSKTSSAKDCATKTCASKDVCVAKLVWKRINDSIYDAVNSIMLDELVRTSRENRNSGNI